jgi:hypothetical protein
LITIPFAAATQAGIGSATIINKGHQNKKITQIQNTFGRFNTHIYFLISMGWINVGHIVKTNYAW